MNRRYLQIIEDILGAPYFFQEQFRAMISHVDIDARILSAYSGCLICDPRVGF